MAYHGYALQAMEELVDAGQHLGLPLAESLACGGCSSFPRRMRIQAASSRRSTTAIR